MESTNTNNYLGGVTKYGIIIISFIVLTWFLKLIASFAIPVVLGVVLGLLFAPILLYMKGKRVSTFLIIILIVILFLIACISFTSILLRSLYSISSKFAEYQTKVLEIIAIIQDSVSFIDSEVLLETQRSLFQFLRSNVLSYSTSAFQFVTSFASQYLIVAFTMVFVLLERSLLHVKIKMFYNQEYHSRQADKQDGESLSDLVTNINLEISRFLVLKMLISLITSIIVYIGFGIIGVDFKFIWAVLTFLFNFIPTIGSIIITLLAVMFSFLQFFPVLSPVLAVIVLTLSAQMIIGNFLDPKLMGDTLNLSPLVIWLALIYWSWVWGIMGALLAIPITVTIRAICDYIPSLKVLGMFMGNSSLILKRNQGLDEGVQSLHSEEYKKLDIFGNYIGKISKKLKNKKEANGKHGKT